jgi:hypothetical protein
MKVCVRHGLVNSLIIDVKKLEVQAQRSITVFIGFVEDKISMIAKM